MFFKKHINLFVFLAIFSNTSFAKGAHDNYTDFEVKGAMLTEAQSINASGIVIGNYVLDTLFKAHGFIRMPNGEITKFDVPGAEFTYPVSINSAGMVTGTARSDIDMSTHEDCSNTSYCESFIRTLDGKITTFAVSEAKGGTLAVAINDSGTITGFAGRTDPYKEAQGFVRQADGTIITFDVVPGARYTRPTSINNSGIVVGCYNMVSTGREWACSDAGHGFMRMTDGTFITFDVPGKKLTYPTGINDKGEISGFYGDDSFSDRGVFLRTTDGIITTFSAPNSPDSIPDFKIFKINKEGVIIGNYYSIRPYLHAGFIREPSGAIRELKHPYDKEDHNYTFVSDINDAGIVVGHSGPHSFLLNTNDGK